MQNYPLTFGASLAILCLSLMFTGHAELETVPFIDKMVHSGIYFGLAICFWSEWSRTHGNYLPNKALLIGTCYPISFSAIMEILQAHCTTYRSGDILDLAANSIGVLAALLCTMAAKYLGSHRNSRI